MENFFNLTFNDEQPYFSIINLRERERPYVEALPLYLLQQERRPLK